MRLTIFWIAACSLMLGMGGCNLINPKEQQPTYVRIDSFNFVPGIYSQEGSASHRITSAWVYYNNQPVGIFELPATIPVLAQPGGTLLVRAGIDFNGLSGFKVPYPYYRFDSLIIPQNAGAPLVYTPQTGYYDSLRLYNNFDFEAGNPFSVAVGDTAMVKVTSPDSVFEGTGSGLIYMKSGMLFSDNVAEQDPFLPPLGREVYMELNYRCNIPFEVGLQAETMTGTRITEYFAGVNPRDTWNKIYIGLTSFIGNNPAIAYRVVIRPRNPNPGQDGIVLLDNIKVISF